MSLTNEVPESKSTDKLYQVEAHELQSITIDNAENPMKNTSSLLATLFHTQTIPNALRLLETDKEKGLTSHEAQRRLELFGLNEITGDDGIKWYKILASQVLTPMTAILTLGLILALVGQDYVESGVIIFVLLTNTIIGFNQEYRAEKTMETLRKMASPTARVLRNTTVAYISANQVVPGDILMFEEGDIIPADARLIECFHLEIDEALLTGESVPVQKLLDTIPNPDEPIGDRVNLVYSTTTVTKGRGKAVVHRTGLGTEMGRIALEIEKAGKASSSLTGSVKTGLEKTLDYLAYFLLLMVAILAVVVFAANSFVFRQDVAAYALSVVIAVLPEGLTAVITITMAFGVATMAKQKAIVRKRMALEAVGAVTNICSDKTGTLTQGKMVVTTVYIPSVGFYAVEGVGYKPIGRVSHVENENQKVEDGKIVLNSDVPLPLLRFTQCGSLCNMSIIKRRGISSEAERTHAIHPEVPVDGSYDETKSSAGEVHQMHDAALEATKPQDWEAIGDPTEAALQCFGWKLRLGKPHLASAATKSAPLSLEVIQEFAFDATLKRMSMIYKEIVKDIPESPENDSPSKIKEVKYWIFAKGAVESIFDLCSGIISKDGDVKINDDQREKLKSQVLENMEKLAAKGLRVLALAYRPLYDQNQQAMENLPREDAENDLVFLGLSGIYDPPRKESKAAVQECRDAGISVHMLTGDHPKTAISIAKEIEILPKDGVDEIVLGKGFYSMIATDFDKLTDEEIDQLEKLPTVIARCSPVTKVKMVDALIRRTRVVAMTGDGTNDAPSLKKANVGIAMGMNGSDVAKQASDIVLTDDNFATIVKAVAEGRRIFTNIRKFILHLMAGNVAEIIALVIGLAFRDENGQSVYLMSPVQILFLNMLTSSPPAMGLGLEIATIENMEEPPRDATKGARSLFSNETIIDIMYHGTLMGMFSLAAWVAVLYNPYAMSQTSTPLGKDCNLSDGPQCNIVFRARATSFLTLTFLIMLHAFNCRSMRKSIIYGSEFAGWKAHISNRFLIWSVVFGLVITILTVYIPVVNTSAFKQLPIDWEWGIVLGSTLLFLALSELYKLFKNKFFPRHRPVAA